jgi:tRNA C32,U32 (ribose-2'-O)-methylase TrmJ
MGCIVAGRGIRGYTNERLQKFHLFVKVRVNPSVKLGVSVGIGHKH